jgi:hypothetical protein
MMNTNENLKTVLLGFLLLFVTFLFFVTLINSITIPDVYVSNSTEECVKVINYDSNDNYSCDNLPSKYHKVWVK